MKFSSVKIICTLVITFLLFAVSCKKKDETNERPALTISKPIDNWGIYVGDSFIYEGLASDKENLATLHYEISSPNASYNYHAEGSKEITGFNNDFKDWITIPVNGPVGGVNISFYVKDTEGNESDRVTRKIITTDHHAPWIVYDSHDINNLDVIRVTMTKDSRGIFNTFSIYNVTQAQDLAHGADNEGFNKLTFWTTNSTDNIQEVDYSMADYSDETSYSFEYTVDQEEDFYTYYYLRIRIREYGVHYPFTAKFNIHM